MELSELIGKVLERRGFTIISNSTPMIVRGTEGDYVVLILRDSTEREALKDAAIDGKSLVISLEYGMRPMGDLFWSREDLDAVVGALVLDETLGFGVPGDIIASFEDAFVENREPVARSIPEASPSDEGIIGLKELVPFHVLKFSIDSDAARDSGILLVDALDGSIYVASSPFIADAGMDASQKKEPEIRDKDALEAAVSYIIKEHTQEVQIKNEMGSVTVLETKSMSPSESDIGLDYLGIAYMPVFFTENEEGILAIDGSGIMGFRKDY